MSRSDLIEFARWVGKMYDCSLAQMNADEVVARFIAERQMATIAERSTPSKLWKVERVDDGRWVAVTCDSCGFWNGFSMSIISPSIRLREEDATRDGENSKFQLWVRTP